MSQSNSSQDKNHGSEPDSSQAAAEKLQPTVSEPDGFKNDPDDPTNPNEVIERARRQVRP